MACRREPGFLRPLYPHTVPILGGCRRGDRAVHLVARPAKTTASLPHSDLVATPVDGFAHVAWPFVLPWTARRSSLRPDSTVGAGRSAVAISVTGNLS